jgi:cell wall-associated NlpC family hydrolase
MTEHEQRQAVITEALSWERTPHHNGASIKGHGVDCGRYPVAVYSACGLIPAIDIPRYSHQFHLHSDVEWYKSIVEAHGSLVENPLPGDFALYKIGRIYSHGAIVVEWPRIIHAWIGIGVTQDMGDKGHLANKKVLFYSPWKKES